jgi:hypothetical protein
MINLLRYVKNVFLKILYSSKIISVASVRFEVRFKHKKHFKLVSNLESLGTRYISGINWDNSQLHFFSVNLLAQNLHRLKSIVLLLKCGLSADVWPLFRTLIENALDYDYITKNPDKLELYFQYSIHLDLKRIERRSSVAKQFSNEQKGENSDSHDYFTQLFNQKCVLIL